MNCSSTWMPISVVTAQPTAQTAARYDRPGQCERAEPRRRSTTAWASPTTSTGHGSLDDQVGEAGLVVDERSAEAEPDHQAERGGEDPARRRGAGRRECPGLDGAEHGAGEQAADEGRAEAVDRADEEVAANPPSGKPTKETIQRRRSRGQVVGGVDGRGSGGGGGHDGHGCSCRGGVGSRWGSLAGDPGREEVVGVVGEVVAHQRVEEVGVAAQVGVGEDDELSVPGGHGAWSAARTRYVGSVGQQGGGDEQRRAMVVGGGPRQHLGGGGGLAADEAADQGGVVVGACMVQRRR